MRLLREGDRGHRRPLPLRELRRLRPGETSESSKKYRFAVGVANVDVTPSPSKVHPPTIKVRPTRGAADGPITRAQAQHPLPQHQVLSLTETVKTYRRLSRAYTYVSFRTAQGMYNMPLQVRVGRGQAVSSTQIRRTRRNTDTILCSLTFCTTTAPPGTVPTPVADAQCQACFLSHKASSEQDDGAGEARHLPSHDVTRIMGKPAVPDRAPRV